ncbi:low affinity iron permease family protein [Nordella sp. HKS 07]|uniref:low affinity iron permease family protein n=1 Tax=Nordella sp. HKS 07 TaxID=2712222 RepID=UPI0013E1C4E8|nr:low affinity iron permease family protein [Nordella sp. HKS 07]QIG50398.1 low affinity iron permease family protein [Nordella sp. HKS 07]
MGSPLVVNSLSGTDVPDQAAGTSPHPDYYVPATILETPVTKAHKPTRSFSDHFATFASKVAWASGSPITSCVALVALLAWGASGPIFHYSPNWQLVINTGTTIVTFMMVFVIQNSQNRDGLAAQIKLDEIIRAVGGAKNSMIDLECLSDDELAELRAKFSEMADEARKDEHKVESAEGRKNTPRSSNGKTRSRARN